MKLEERRCFGENKIKQIQFEEDGIWCAALTLKLYKIYDITYVYFNLHNVNQKLTFVL